MSDLERPGEVPVGQQREGLEGTPDLRENTAGNAIKFLDLPAGEGSRNLDGAILNGLDSLYNERKIALLPLIIERLDGMAVIQENLLLTASECRGEDLEGLVYIISELYSISLLLYQTINSEDGIQGLKMDKLAISMNKILSKLEVLKRSTELFLGEKLNLKKQKLGEISEFIAGDERKAHFPIEFTPFHTEIYNKVVELKGLKRLEVSAEGNPDNPLNYINQLLELLKGTLDFLLNGEHEGVRETERLAKQRELVENFTSQENGYQLLREGMLESKGIAHERRFGNVLTEAGEKEIESRRMIAYVDFLANQGTQLHFRNGIEQLFKEVKGFKKGCFKSLRWNEAVAKSIGVDVYSDRQSTIGDIYHAIRDEKFQESGKLTFELVGNLRSDGVCEVCVDYETLQLGGETEQFLDGGRICIFRCSMEMFQDHIEPKSEQLVEIFSSFIKMAAKEAMLEIGEVVNKNK